MATAFLLLGKMPLCVLLWRQVLFVLPYCCWWSAVYAGDGCVAHKKFCVLCCSSMVDHHGHCLPAAG
jgi:hypothetical protein